jgi:hypothetical protein
LARRAATAAGVAGLLVAAVAPASAATAVSARAATTPSWSVSQALGPDKGVWVSALVPDSANDAWATWKALGKFSVEHWTGSSWSQVPVPANYLTAAKSAVALGASSASNAWLFDHGQVLRWDGSQWSIQKIPSWVVAFSRAGFYYASTEVLSSSDVWVFSAHVAHYNGHIWARVSLPGSPVAEKAVSPDDMWVLSATSTASTPTYVLLHWDGSTWTSVPVPTATPPTGANEYLGSLAASGPTDVWLQRIIQKGTSGARTLSLLHWDGTAWTHVKLGFPTSFVSYMAPDGNGGLWLVANGKKPSYPLFLYHFSSGQWSETTMPAAAGMKVLDITGLSWVPGTQSLWATGNMVAQGNHIFGTTWSYGP